MEPAVEPRYFGGDLSIIQTPVHHDMVTDGLRINILPDRGPGPDVVVAGSFVRVDEGRKQKLCRCTATPVHRGP